MKSVRSRALSVLSLGVLCGPALAAETLSNGIELPNQWPPQHGTNLTRQPLGEPPYLKQLPKVIPINVGRQLFVDDFLIESGTLQRTHHLPEYHAASPVIGPDQPWEGKGSRARAGVFSDGVWFDPRDRLFKAWYWSGAVSEQPLRYATCLATSRDGIRWEKPVAAARGIAISSATARPPTGFIGRLLPTRRTVATAPLSFSTRIVSVGSRACAKVRRWSAVAAAISRRRMRAAS
ncbi:MAG: hypothetical protein EBS84_12645 [Proteobacteria bacterium]|nr:hypothetical protein [Pseudomonadota bacterium]